MSQLAINLNKLPVVKAIYSEEDESSDDEQSLLSNIISVKVYDRDKLLYTACYLIPIDLQEYDFVWLQDEGVEAMWSHNEFIIDSSEQAQSFKSSRSVKVLDWMFSNLRVMLLIPVGLLAWWLITEFGVKGAIINIIGWTAIWYAYRSIKQSMKS